MNLFYWILLATVYAEVFVVLGWVFGERWARDLERQDVMHMLFRNGEHNLAERISKAEHIPRS